MTTCFTHASTPASAVTGLLPPGSSLPPPVAASADGALSSPSQPNVHATMPPPRIQMKSRRCMSVLEVRPLADDPLVDRARVLALRVRRDEASGYEVRAHLAVVVVEVDDGAVRIDEAREREGMPREDLVVPPQLAVREDVVVPSLERPAGVAMADVARLFADLDRRC